MSKYHPAVAHMMRSFRYSHLPPHLQEVSKDFHDLAVKIADRGSSPETTVALRKLWEAKNSAVLDVSLATQPDPLDD